VKVCFTWEVNVKRKLDITAKVEEKKRKYRTLCPWLFGEEIHCKWEENSSASLR